MDLKLLNNGGYTEFGYQNIPVNILESETISAPPASRIETIANKVVKFMLTEYGSNFLDTSYGSKWILTTQVSKEFLSRYILIISSDIERCIAYIKAGEINLPNTVDKLYTVKFNGLEFSTIDLLPSTEILFKITIYTTFGNKALFTLTR